MKKNVLNDKTIRAIAIGLSAMIATAQPMTAFAEEIVPASDSDAKVEVKPSTEQEAKNAVDKDKYVDKAVAQVENVEKAAEEYKEVSKLDSQKEAVENIDSNVSDLDENLDAAEKDMDSASANLGKVQDANEDIIEENAKTEDIVSSLTKTAADIYSTVKKANDAVDSYDEEIKNASSIAAATTAYENIVAEAEEAEKAYEEAEKKYDDLMAEYDDALSKVGDAVKAYEEALGSGSDNISDAADKLAKAKENAEAIKAEAVNVKEAAKVERDRLKAEADKAYNALLEKLKAARVEEKKTADTEYNKAIAGIDATHEAAKKAASDAYEAAKQEADDKYYPKKEAAIAAKNEAIDEANKEYEAAIAAAKAQEADTKQAIEAINNSEKAKLLEDIEAQKQKINEIKNSSNKSNYYLEADKLVNLLVKNSLYDNEDVDPSSISMSQWTRGQGNGNNVKVTYKLKGSDEVITEYFDYVTCDESGNTINGYVDASQIKVVKKNPVLKSENGDVITVESSEEGDVFKVNGSELKDNQTAKVNANGTITVVTTELDRTDVSYKNGESEITVQVDNKNKTMYKVDGKPLNDNANVKYTVIGNETDGYTVTKSEYKDVDFHYEYNVKDLYLTLDKKGKVSIAKQESWDSFIPVTYKNVKWDDEKQVYTAEVKGWYTIGWEYKEFTFSATNKTRKQKDWVDTTTVYSKVETPVYKDSEETFKTGFIAKGDEYYTNEDLLKSISGFEKSISDLENALEVAKKKAAEEKDAKIEKANSDYTTTLESLRSQRKAEYQTALNVYETAIKDAKTACTNAKAAANTTKENAKTDADNKYDAAKEKAGQDRDNDKKAAVADYDAKHAYYENLYKEATTQLSRVEKAQTAVAKIQNQIATLSPDTFDAEEYGDFAGLKIWYEARLNAAKADLDAAKESLDEIMEDVETAKADLANTVRRLTPNNDNRRAVAGPVAEDVFFVDDGTLHAVAAPAQGVQVAAVANGQAVNANGGAQVLELADAQTPLADFAEEPSLDKENGITLEDAETPLVDFAEKENMNWWWLIVVAVLGATGVELYRKNQKKKAKVEAVEKK